jgi:hypothetical protein
MRDTAAGMGSLGSVGATVSEVGQGWAGSVLVRPLGAYERFFYLLTQREPRHFVISVTFKTVLTGEQVQSALTAVMERHVLLGTHVEDHPGTRLGFYRPAHAPRVQVAVRPPKDNWRSVVGEELSRIFDASTGVLLRAVLCWEKATSRLLLVFNHTGADGMSAMFVVRDLVAALNGHRLELLPTPSPHEELIARTLVRAEKTERSVATAQDPRMAKPVSFRAFDGTPPRVGTAVLDAGQTKRLIERCRAEGTTVHAALVAAASRVRSTMTSEDFVRVMTPFSVRGLIGAGEESGLYFFTVRTGIAPHDGSTFWDQARTAEADIRAVRSPATVASLSALFQRSIPVDADDASVQAFVGDSLNYEMMISNLGVLDMESFGPIRPTEVWGPLLRNQSDQGALGVVTFDGRLHLTLCGYGPTEEFISGVAQTLHEAS